MEEQTNNNLWIIYQNKGEENEMLVCNGENGKREKWPTLLIEKDTIFELEKSRLLFALVAASNFLMKSWGNSEYA